ncbi:uncharacterized protein LOC101857442 [Aplysia californica]|uniref:Uncharacterized protein LOC101857442 n=1 Tax=Aplysia californica TaxID=6500 RepID=A0ABM0K5A3_APLCA|nr:uncharacterized protein LOC101857442 [Aplysia californica]
MSDPQKLTLPSIKTGTNSKKRVLTKTVQPEWYRRYVDILPKDERVYVQPIREINEEKAMIAAMKTPPIQKDRAEELARKLAIERGTRIQTVLELLEGNTKNAKEKLDSLKPMTSALKYLTESRKDGKDSLSARSRLELLIPPGWKLRPESRWRMFRNNKLIRTKIHTLHNEMREAKVRHRWQKAIRTVRAVIRFRNIIADIARTTGDVFKQFNLVMAREMAKNREKEGLYFDKSYYKASTIGKNLDIGSIYTLGKTENNRTDDEVQKAAVNLRFLRSFAAFPAYFQKLMAKIGWYIEVPSDKVIIREGQPPHYFYFLMSGKAVAVKLTGSPVFEEHGGFEVHKVYERDALFGEEGIFGRAYRQYSVTCIETCRLLSINIDDYNRMCLGADSEDENPEHIRLVSQLDFMRYFPMKKLIEEADGNIILFYFPAGHVITRKTEESDYIYVIKSGTCRVLAEVQMSSVWGEQKTRTMKVVVPPFVEAKDSNDSMMTLEIIVNSKSDEVVPVVADSRKSSGSRKRSEGVRIIQRDSSTQSVRRRSQEFISNGGRATASSQRDSRFLVTRMSLMSERKSMTSQSMRGAAIAAEQEEDLDSHARVTVTTLRIMDRLKSTWDNDDTMATSVQKMKAEKHSPLCRAASIEKILVVPGRSQVVKEMVWVYIKDLRETDVVGIEDIELGDDKEGEPCDIAVVSEGSEVILISKKYFMDNASPKMRAHLRASSFIMPDEFTLALELKRQQYWKSFKNKCVRDLEANRKKAK